MELPKWWSEDSVSYFISEAYQNCVATMSNYRGLPIIVNMVTANDLFAKALKIESSPTKELLLPNFLGRSHSAYLGAIRLSASGQVPESYMLLRACIENGLYALHVQSDPTLVQDIPERVKAWAERHDNEEGRRRCRKEFGYGNVLKTLEGRDSALLEQIGRLYDQTIDLGAHPNLMGHLTTGDISATGGYIGYLIPGNMDICKLAIQMTVEVGISVLRIYELIYTDRFDDIAKDLAKLS